MIPEDREQLAVDICVIGLGYIGLPTAAFMADAGFFVQGVDTNPRVVEQVNNGVTPFREPGFDSFLHAVVEGGRLHASAAPGPADAFIISVPTPFLESHSVDLAYVEAATREVAKVVQRDNLVILESTSPPGTTEQVKSQLESLRPDLSGLIHFVHAPERVLPGNIMYEMVNNGRIIGGDTVQAAERAARYYQAFCIGDISLTDTRTAEMAKLAENSFRDVNIAFANELANICDRLDIDVWELRRLANKHPRVNILSPGPGVGGHCIAVDPWFIVSAAPEETKLIQAAREVNEARPEVFVRKALAALANVRSDDQIAVLGLTFKPNVDDLRESPSLTIVRRLLAESVGHKLNLSDPRVDTLPEDIGQSPRVELVDFTKAIQRSKIVLLLVDHDEFLEMPESWFRGKIVVDAKGIR